MNRTALTGSTLGSLFFVSLILRMFGAAGGAEPAKSTPEPVPAALAAAAQEPADDGPWLASQRFFAGWTSAGCKPAAAGTAEAWCVPASMPLAAMIAIAPDPAHTHLALTFDRTLEAIQLAAQMEHFVLDRYWLPWSADTKVGAGDTSSALSAASAEARERRATQPGLILFRRSGSDAASKAQVLFVFLVSDTPTAGIDGRQFKQAVTYVQQVCGTGDDSKKNEPKDQNPHCTSDSLRIVGPSFSGSLPSLHRLIDASKQKFTVYSGSVSSLCAMATERLLDKWPSLCGPPDGNYTKSATIDFRTFVHDTESAVTTLVAKLDPSNGGCSTPQVAILSEAATAYGQAMQHDSAHAPDSQGCIESFVFPREIASLRNASHSTSTSGSNGSNPSSAVSAGQLPLDLTDRTNGGDAPPDFSTTQGPLSKEAVLMNMAADLRRNRFQYVGIAGTNVLDILFLTNFLRSASPDSRLFMVSADLLFERELDNTPYVGMLALTTYPLVNRSLDSSSATADGEPQLPFADEAERGEYEAARQTLKEMNSQLSAEVKAPEVKAPALWMMVVGTGGYWPVRRLDLGPVDPPTAITATEPASTPSLPPQLNDEDLAGAWQVLVIIVCGVAAIHIGVLLTASPFGSRFRDFAPVGAVPRQRLFYIQGACATLALALGVLMLPVWQYGPPGSLLQIVGTLAAVAVVSAALLLEAVYCLRWRWRHGVDPSARDSRVTTLGLQVATFVGVWGFAAALLYEWWRLLSIEADEYGFFFALRAMHPGNGVSPLTPLLPLFITVYAWMCFEIWRLRFNEDMRPRLSTGGSHSIDTDRPRPGEMTEAPIADAVNRYLLRPGYLVPFVTVFIVWLGFLHPMNPFQLFEKRAFSQLYGVLFCLVVALMLSSGFRMAQIWVDLRKLLIELDCRPVRAAFSRLKGMSWSFWRQGGEDAEWADMARSLEGVGRMASGGNPASSGVPDLAYFDAGLARIRASAEKMKDAIDQLPPYDPSAPALPPMPALVQALTGLDGEVERMQTALASGEGNAFLRTAFDNLRASVKAVIGAAPAGSAPVIRSSAAAAMTKLGEVDLAIALQKSSGAAQACVGSVVSVWRRLQKQRPLFAALDSLVEYRQAASSQAGGDSRIAAYFALEIGFRKLQDDLAEVLRRAWDALEPRWRRESAQLIDHDDRADLDTKPGVLPDLETRQMRVLEEYVALRYVTFIRGVLGHLRHVMIFLALSFSLVLISLNVYSFEPHQSLIWSFTLIFVVTGFMVVGVLVQLHRDPILSRVTGTTGHALDLHFYLRIVAFGAVPLLTLLATHYPSIGRYLVSFLQPSLEALK